MAAQEAIAKGTDVGEWRTAPSWGEDFKAYTHRRRTFVDPGLFAGPTFRLDNGSIANVERAFDPLVQKFLDEDRELKQQSLERTVKDQNRDRAVDVQLRREHTWNLVNHEDKLFRLRGRNSQEPKLSGRRTLSQPSGTEYNILSNIPFNGTRSSRPEQQSLAKPHEPSVKGKTPRDFNILTNRYVFDHEAKAEKDHTLLLSQVTHKCRTQLMFNPVLQTFSDSAIEDRVQLAETARDVEVLMRLEAKLPLTNRGNAQNSYDVITHQVRDPEMLGVLDHAEGERKARYKLAYEVQKQIRAADFRKQEIARVQKLQSISYQRFEDTAHRGYDILTGIGYGTGPKDKKLHLPCTLPNLSLWEKAQIQPSASSQAPVIEPYLGEFTIKQRTPIRLASAGGQAVQSARGPTPQRVAVEAPMSARFSNAKPKSQTVPPAPAVPGSPKGSVYSRSKASGNG